MEVMKQTIQSPMSLVSKQETMHHDLIVRFVWNKLKYRLCFPCLKNIIKLCYFIYCESF